MVYLSATLSLKPIRLYWGAYGGWRALALSPYLWVAIAITIILLPAWTKLDNDVRPWAQLPLQILPNILGFSMGGMAITLAFTGSSLFRVIAQYGKENSYFIKMIAAFYHFIIMQTLAILFGLICQVYNNVIFSGFGFFLMIYAIMVAAATATQIFNTARIANVASKFTEAQLDAANTPSTAAKPGALEQPPSP